MLIATTASPRLIGDFPPRTEIYIEVKTPAANVWLANSAQTLEAAIGITAGGLEFSSLHGVRRLPWRGPMWAVGAGGIVDVEIL